MTAGEPRDYPTSDEVDAALDRGHKLARSDKREASVTVSYSLESGMAEVKHLTASLENPDEVEALVAKLRDLLHEAASIQRT